MFNMLLEDFNVIYLLFCIREEVATTVISTSKIITILFKINFAENHVF